MNKIDKLLYGGFAAGIVAMLMSVFSPPKQTAEDIAENPAISQESIADDNRINAIDQHQNFEPPPDYEALVRILKAEEEARRKAKEAEEAKENAWWESRHDWVERFPFEPTYHPEITFDPADEETRKMVKNHGFLKMFYNCRLPYTKEFEQLYDIVKEVAGEEKADNPIVLGNTFSTLKEYLQAKAQDPETIYRKNAKVALPPSTSPTNPKRDSGNIDPRAVHGIQSPPRKGKESHDSGT